MVIVADLGVAMRLCRLSGVSCRDGSLQSRQKLAFFTRSVGSLPRPRPISIYFPVAGIILLLCKSYSICVASSGSRQDLACSGTLSRWMRVSAFWQHQPARSFAFSAFQQQWLISVRRRRQSDRHGSTGRYQLERDAAQAQGSFQNENGIDFSQRNGGREFDGTNSLLVALGNCTLSGVFGRRPDLFCAGKRKQSLPSGFSLDVTPAIKRQISPSPGKLRSFLRRSAPDCRPATKAVVGRGVQPYVQFPWSSQLSGGWSISGMWTNFIAPADAGNKLSTETTFVLEREFGERAFLFIEYVSATTTSMVDPAVSSIPAAVIGSHRRSRLICISVLGSTTTHRRIFSGLAWLLIQAQRCF